MNQEINTTSGAKTVRVLKRGTPIHRVSVKDEEKMTPEQIREYVKGSSYHLDRILARGAESVLYIGICNDIEVCIKCIRSGLNRWIGDEMTRHQEEKLAGVSYRTKKRHIENEWKVGNTLFKKETDVPVVHLYDIRKVRSFGLEVGYDLIMERLCGHDLSDKVIQQVLTLPEKLELMVQCAQALDYLHKRHFTHLDIKPSNFMIHHGKAKLIDFGVSVPIGYQPTAITGTGGYLSPEQICKDRVNAATDLFAFGISMAVFFGGAPIRQTQEELKLKSYRSEAQQLLQNGTVPLCGDLPDLDEYPELQDILKRCTIPRRDLRTDSCGKLLHQFKIWAKDNKILLDAFQEP